MRRCPPIRSRRSWESAKTLRCRSCMACTCSRHTRYGRPDAAAKPGEDSRWPRRISPDLSSSAMRSSSRSGSRRWSGADLQLTSLQLILQCLANRGSAFVTQGRIVTFDAQQNPAGARLYRRTLLRDVIRAGTADCRDFHERSFADAGESLEMNLHTVAKV